MKKLTIAIDPGFDAVKVVANGLAFKFPFNVLQTDEGRFNDYAVDEDFYLYKLDSNGRTYRVGKYARNEEFESKNEAPADRDWFYTKDRFNHEEFKVGLETAIAIGLQKTGLLNQQDQVDIRVMVALPHEYRNEFQETVRGKLAGIHDFSMKIGTAEMQKFHFDINSKKIYTLSQTMAAIIGETSEEDGTINAKKYKYLANGPTLVLDGGYYTFGVAYVGRNGSVNDDRCFSSTKFAMKNVNEAVAAELRKFEKNNTSARHEYIEYMTSDIHQSRIINNKAVGEKRFFDLEKVKKEKIKETCNAFIEYLEDKYNFNDINYILVAGGTGATYFNQLSQYFTDNYTQFTEENFILASTEMYGSQSGLEYSVAIGAYKGLMGLTPDKEGK